MLSGLARMQCQCTSNLLGVARSAAGMLADPGELPTILGLGVTGEPLLALRIALWPSPIWQLVAEELLESFTVVLKRNRFRPGVETCLLYTSPSPRD